MPSLESSVVIGVVVIAMGYTFVKNTKSEEPKKMKKKTTSVIEEPVHIDEKIEF